MASTKRNGPTNEAFGWSEYTVRKWLKNGQLSTPQEIGNCLNEQEIALIEPQRIEPGEVVDASNTAGAIQFRMTFLRRLLNTRDLDKVFAPVDGFNGEGEPKSEEEWDALIEEELKDS